MILLATFFTLLVTGWSGATANPPPGEFCDISLDVEHKQDQRLTGHVLHVLHDVDVLQCTMLCSTTEARCKSFNYHAANRVCEISDQDARLRGGSLVAVSGWRYYQRKVPTTESLQMYGSEHCFKNECAPGMMFNNVTRMCYSVFLTPLLPRTGANTFCTEKYGRLANFKTFDQFSFIEGEITSKYGTTIHLYFGLEKIASTWMWSDGDVATMSTLPWFSGQPDDYLNPDGPENCGSIEWSDIEYLPRYGFMDVPCTLNWSFVCEYDPWMYTFW